MRNRDAENTNDVLDKFELTGDELDMVAGGIGSTHHPIDLKLIKSADPKTISGILAPPQRSSD